METSGCKYASRRRNKHLSKAGCYHIRVETFVESLTQVIESTDVTNAVSAHFRDTSFNAIARVASSKSSLATSKTHDNTTYTVHNLTTTKLIKV